VVEDYRTLALSLRAHPLQFLREQLATEGVVRCGDLTGIRDGRHVEVAGVILVRQRPGSARGVLFITIEDETGVANSILWPDRFEKQRRLVMSASMVSLRGRLQKEGQVIHVIVDRVIPRDDMLRSVGRMDMPVTFGRGDGATHAGSPDRGEAGWRPGPRDLYSPPFPNGTDPEDLIKVRSHDFH
jgi:error-prone DNA polymerase